MYTYEAGAVILDRRAEHFPGMNNRCVQCAYSERLSINAPIFGIQKHANNMLLL